MPAYNSFVTTKPEFGPQVPHCVPGIPQRVWDGDFFNAHASPWVVQFKSATIPSSVNSQTVAFAANPTAGSNIHVFVVAKTTGAPAITVTVEGASITSLVEASNPYGVADYAVSAIAGGLPNVVIANNGAELLVILVEIAGASSTTIHAAPTFAYLSELAASITTTTAHTLLLGFLYNGSGGFGTSVSVGAAKARLLEKVQAGSDSAILFSAPIAVGAATALDILTLSARQAVLLLVACEQGSISTSPNALSQQVLLAGDGKFPNHFSVDYGFSADPGTYSLEVMIADVDDPTKYVVLDTLATGLNASFQGHAEYINVTGRYVYLNMATITNAVSATADIVC